MVISSRFIILFCCALSLFSNFFLSLSKLPIIFTTLTLSFRDVALILLTLFWPLLIKKNTTNIKSFYLYFLYIFSVFIFFLQLIFVPSNAPLSNSIALSRIVLALPILTILFCSIWSPKLNKESNLIEIFFNFFLIICIIESIFLVIGQYSIYLSLIGFQEYLAAKGTSSGTAFGFFGSRIITPLFNASVGGMVLAFLFGYYLMTRKKLLAFLTLIPLIFTVSKTGYLIALNFLLFRRLSGYSFLALAFLYLVLAFTFINFDLTSFPIPEVFSPHIASVKYHMHGLITGIEKIFFPVGLGNAGTVPGVDMPELIGRESGFGVGLGTSGMIYIISFLLSAFIIVSNYKNIGLILVSGYFMVSLMNEASSSFYVWVPILVLFLKTPNLIKA